MLFETNKNYWKNPFFWKQKIRRPNQESLESLEDGKQGTRKKMLKWVYEVDEPIPFNSNEKSKKTTIKLDEKPLTATNAKP